MCGPSSEMQGLETQSADFSKILQQDFGTRFQDQSNLLSQLNQSLSPIIAAGPGQQGMTPEEKAARTTEAINTSGGNYRNALQGVQLTLAGRGGGGADPAGIGSGIEDQIRGSIASAGANQLSTAENQITSENYALGRDQYNRAMGGGQTLAGLYDPQQFGQMSGSASGQAFSEADKIQTMKNQREAAIAGGITSLATSAFTGGMSALAGGIPKMGSPSGGGSTFSPGQFDFTNEMMPTDYASMG